MDRSSYLFLLPIEIRRLVERLFYYEDRRNHNCCRGEDAIELKQETPLWMKIASVIMLGQEQDAIDKRTRRLENLQCVGSRYTGNYIHSNDLLRDYLVNLREKKN